MLTRQTRFNVTRFNTETFAYRDAIVANGGTISASSLLAADAFVTICKARGLWPKFVDVGLFLGDQLAGALVKLVATNGQPITLTNHNFVGGDYTESGGAGGLQGDGATKYLATGLTDAGVLAASLAFYSRTVVNNAANHCMLGVGTGADNTALRHLSTTADEFAYDGVATSFGQNSQTGLYSGSRQTFQDYRLYLNGRQIAANLPGAPAAESADGAELYVFARNEDGVAAEFWPGLATFYAIGTAMTPADMQALAEAVTVLQTSLNRN